MTIISYIAFFFLSITLQVNIVPLFSIKGISPDLVLILVIAVAIRHGKFWGVVAGFFAGLIFDAFGTAFLGLSSLVNSIAAFVAGFLLGEQLEQRFVVVVSLIFASLLIHDFFYYIVLAIGTPISFWATLFKHVLPQSFYTMVFMVIIHLVLPKGLWGRAKRY